MSALSVSAWELTETYSPAAMDMAPATSPATPARSTLRVDAWAAETPPPASDTRRNGRLREEAVRYASLAVTLGADREEALATFEAAWRSLKDGGSQGEEE